MHAIARALEDGAYDGQLARALARAWEHTLGRAVVRKLAWPPWVRVVAVGGATLGGSGKTPLAIACAAELAASGASVALVGHAYRAKPRRARVVRRSDPIGEVGDEALLAAASLEPYGVRVVVAPARADAIAFAARIADVLVVDGVAQTAPARASLALLAVDGAKPWGRAAAVPPAGDLRAPISSLRAACDMVVAVGDDRPRALPEAHHARLELHGVRVEGRLLGWDEVARQRVGLLCALARPDRVVRSLERRGVRVRALARARDHGPFTRALLDGLHEAAVDIWLVTPKCRCALDASRLTSTKAREAVIGEISAACLLPGALKLELAKVAKRLP